MLIILQQSKDDFVPEQERKSTRIIATQVLQHPLLLKEKSPEAEDVVVAAAVLL